MEVAHTAELQRVLSLPRRTWLPEQAYQLAGAMTDLLVTPAGRAAGARLKPHQAIALYEAASENGLFAPLGVGEGKTLITLLLPSVFPHVAKPLLLVPGGLVEKTRRDRGEYARHWQISPSLRLLSYNWLGLVQAAHELEQYAPDLIIADEAHRLKNKRAAVTRRVARYMHDRPTTVACMLSGSFMDRSLGDWAHIACWCLKTKVPIPTLPEEIVEWSEALDRGVDPLARRATGALRVFFHSADRDEPVYVQAQRGFRRRLVETPGVVATVGEGERVDCSIYVQADRHKVSPTTEGHFKKLRETWTTPDDWQLQQAVDVWRHAQELALGLYYRWDPRPPDEWRAARKNWHKFVRDTISRSRTFDSELHVANAVDSGRLGEGQERLATWRAIQPTFTPNVVPVWCDDKPLEACAAWLAKASGVVWTEHHFFALRLAKLTGAPYYGAEGFTADRQYIEAAKPGARGIASIDANREGKNLQKIWSRNLIVCPPSSATWWEQVIARTHRPGQEADEVTVDVLLGCRENYDAVLHALADARAVQETMGKTQKLLLADVSIPSEAEIDALRTPRWNKTLERESGPLETALQPRA